MTDSKGAEEALTALAAADRERRLYRTILSTTPDLVYVFDLNHCFTYANKALLDMWGKTWDEAIGKNCLELGYEPWHAAMHDREIEQVIATKQPVRGEVPFAGTSGRRIYDYIFVPVTGEDGEVEAVAGTTRDVTDRKQMESALAASKERLNQIFQQAPVGIIVGRGRDLVVELANPLYQALLQGRELIGRPFAEVVPELGQEVWDVLHRVFDSGEPFTANEWHIPYDFNRDGILEDHWFNLVFHPLHGPDGKVSGMIAVVAEVTEQVLARTETERVNRELEHFAYIASHDLQEPLRMVNIYTQQMIRRLGTQDACLNEYARFVSQGITRMRNLIDDLLIYSRIVRREERPAGPAELSDSLAEALSILKERVEQTGALITASPLPTVRGNTAQLTQVFQNLISNALKYRRSDHRPEIRITAKRERDHWVVSVRDNGIGFEQEYAQSIFGLFKRLHSSEYPGTGLGLAICQRIVERYGGHIWAKGKPGEGATFYFALPPADVR